MRNKWEEKDPGIEHSYMQVHIDSKNYRRKNLAQSYNDGRYTR